MENLQKRTETTTEEAVTDSYEKTETTQDKEIGGMVVYILGEGINHFKNDYVQL